MKAINRNLGVLFISLVGLGGMFCSVQNDSNIVSEKRKESISIVDLAANAVDSVIHQIKMQSITIATAGHVQNYWNKPSSSECSFECSCEWGPNCETTYESKVGVKQYDWNGGYKEVNAKRSSDKESEGSYKTGYDKEMDKNLKK